MKSVVSDEQEMLDVLGHPAVITLMGAGVLFILIAQDVWRTLSGLYFEGAHLIFFAYLVVSLLMLRNWSMDQKIDQLKLTLMTLAFSSMLVLPSVYLLATGQLTPREVIFSDFDASLNHMPYAWVLPFIAIGSLFVSKKKKGNE